MGHAAYARGTQAIRNQIDREAELLRPAAEARHARETARETIEALRQQIETMKAQQALERETYAQALGSLHQATAEIEKLDAALAQHRSVNAACRERRDDYRGRLAKLSEIVRIGMTPERFHAASFTAAMHTK